MANVQTQNRWRRRMAALMLTVMLLVPCMPRALAADLSVDAGFYLKQSRGGACPLTAAAMMLRDSFSLPEECAAVETAALKVLNEVWRTPDIMSEGMRKVGCREMTRLIAERI